MAYTLKTNFADTSNYGKARKTSDIKYIVIHYTGNDGDTDESNGKYFKKKNLKCSAHRFVDDDSVTISVPDLYIAYSVGGGKYSDCQKTGGGKYYGKCTNKNSISIEMCDTKRNGRYDVTESTVANTIALVKELMQKYNIPINNVIRHFDVNGKHCPAYYCANAANDNAWLKFKNRLAEPSIDYSPVFNPTYYANKYADIKAVYGYDENRLLKHFISYGMKEGRQGCANFEVHAYKVKNPDLKTAFGDDLEKYYKHYIDFGRKEGRKCL